MLLAVATAALGCASVVTPHPAAAASATPPSLGDFKLRRTTVDLQNRVDQLDAQLAKSGVQKLLDEANRTATYGSACSSPAFKDMTPPAERYCFDAADTGEIGDPDGTLEWWPQGVTTVADAQADQLWGAKEAILVSWYDKKYGEQKGVRVSFLDPSTRRYRHALLVYPTINSYGNASYEIVGQPEGGIHAGGILWYGNHLYVVDTKRGIRVFDMRYIFDLKASANGDITDNTKIGRHNGVYHGFGYRYVMPQVDAWVNAAGADNDGNNTCEMSGAPKYSFIGLDRSSTPVSAITGEYCSNQDDPNRNGRVARWPLDSATGQPLPDPGTGTWQASEAHRLPAPNVQGAVAWNGRWYLSRSGGGETGNGRLLTTVPDRPTQGVLSIEASRLAAIGPEDLSYWPGRDQLWTVTEHPGKRVLYGVAR